MSVAEKMVNVTINQRSRDGQVCDTDNMDISEADASSIIDRAADLILVFREFETKSAQEFYDAAFSKLDDLEQELIRADVLGDE